MIKQILEDIKAFQKQDPAATSMLSVYLNSPGMRAIWAYRRQHWLWEHGFKGLARLLSTWSRNRWGVEIHPAAQIGKRFMIDHGTGVVIGETTIIGDDCIVYQGATLGGTGKDTGKRHPTLGNNVIVGVGASVLGNITLGDNVKVGGGAVVVDSAPSNCTLIGVPAHAINIKGEVLEDQQYAGLKKRCTKYNYEKMYDEINCLRQITNLLKDNQRKEYLPDPLFAMVEELKVRLDKVEALLEERTPKDE
ncbi:MAG: serine O-acetyltransferase [Coriobacteriia bacterium]|nr:serine O-acetyltransferase [Coriobacteriia bacterium]